MLKRQRKCKQFKNNGSLNIGVGKKINYKETTRKASREKNTELRKCNTTETSITG
jgi:hypothetical protein